MERVVPQATVDPSASVPDAVPAPSWRERAFDLAIELATRMFGTDLRSLAALRIVLALIVLADLAGRATNLRIHYSDEGVLPREVVIDNLAPARWSLAFVNGTVPFQSALFLLTAVAAVWLLLGYRTRLMTVVVWVLMVSIQTRNPSVLSAADTLLRLLLFWGMLLPLGAVWSIDAARAGGQRLAMRVLSFATLGLAFQVAFMYWFTAALKSGDDWRRDGTALYYALGAEQLTTRFGDWAQRFPDVLRLLTFGAFGVEIVAPVLLFSPVRTTACRLVAIGALTGMHLGILLTMNIGIFPWTSALCMLAFLPGPVWDWLEPRVRSIVAARRDRPFPARDAFGRVANGIAGLSGAIRVRLAGRAARRQLSFSSPTAPPGIAGAIPRHSPSGTGQPVDAAAGDAGGPGARAESGAGPPRLRTHPLLNLAAAFCLVFIFGWNMTTVSAYTMPSGSAPVAYSLGLYQTWNMFAPQPPHATIWYVVVGTLGNGERIEMLTPILHDDLSLAAPVQWEQPDNISGSYYRDKYWRKYIQDVVASGQTDEGRQFAAYICRTWNAAHAGDLDVESLRFVEISERTLPDDGRGEQVRKNVASFTCR